MDAPQQIAKLVAEMQSLEKTMSTTAGNPVVIKALSAEYESLDSKLKALTGGASIDPPAPQKTQFFTSPNGVEMVYDSIANLTMTQAEHEALEKMRKANLKTKSDTGSSAAGGVGGVPAADAWATVQVSEGIQVEEHNTKKGRWKVPESQPTFRNAGVVNLVPKIGDGGGEMSYKGIPHQKAAAKPSPVLSKKYATE